MAAGLGLAPLCNRNGAIVVELDPLCLLVQPIAHWDVEVGDLAVVKHEPFRCMIEGVFVVEHALLQMVEAILVALLGDGGVGLAVHNGLE
jgi:hypothetical protein